MSAPVDADVVIVGAGPAGSATALLLARRGHRVVVVDQARFPRPKPCGEYVNPGAVQVIGRLGLAPSAEAVGRSLSGMFIAGPDGSTVWAPFPYGQAWLVPRDRLDDLLLRAAIAGGADLIEGCRVDGVATGVRPIVYGHRGRSAIRIATRLVVGADGLRSVVARGSGTLPAVRHAHYTVGAHFERLRHGEPRGDLHLGDRCYAGAALYGAGCGNVVVALSRASFRRAGGDVGALFARACASLPILRRIVGGAHRVSPFICVGPLGYARRRSVDDGLLLVGDAASTINPMTGEGIFIALRGAELAAEAADGALRTGVASAGALAPYERARTAAFSGIWRTSRLLQWVVRHPRLMGTLFRRLTGDPRLASRLLGALSDLRVA